MADIGAETPSALMHAGVSAATAPSCASLTPTARGRATTLNSTSPFWHTKRTRWLCCGVSPGRSRSRRGRHCSTRRSFSRQDTERQSAGHLPAASSKHWGSSSRTGAEDRDEPPGLTCCSSNRSRCCIACCSSSSPRRADSFHVAPGLPGSLTIDAIVTTLLTGRPYRGVWPAINAISRLVAPGCPRGTGSRGVQRAPIFTGRNGRVRAGANRRCGDGEGGPGGQHNAAGPRRRQKPNRLSRSRCGGAGERCTRARFSIQARCRRIFRP